jgi:succinoglycan biosynthesis protein ExoA
MLLRASQPADTQDAKPQAVATPSVTVIVPVRNEARHIANTLDQLLNQRQEGLAVEILVIDGRSTDNTREIIAGYEQRYPHVRLFDNPGLLSSSARNIAIDQSQGKYLVVIDGHCEIPSRTYLQDLVSAFERTHADCLGRPQPLDVSHATTLQKAVAAARSSPLGHHPASYIYSAEELEVPAGSVAIAYRRSVFDRVGKFDPNFDACEDYELNLRIDKADMKCHLVPSLAVQYHPRDSLVGLFRQLARYGRGRMRMLRKHPESFSLMAFVPAAFFAGVVVGPLLCNLAPVLWYFYWLVIGVYLLAIISASIQAALKDKNLALLPWLPFVFLAVHLGSGYGVLHELAFAGGNGKK